VTTILADFRLGVMISDSSATDEDRVWSERKVRRWRGALVGFAGNVDDAALFFEWLKNGSKGRPPKFGANNACLVLSPAGLFAYHGTHVPQKVERGIEAIGTGAKAAMCAYEALAFTDPVRAVRIVCKHDSGSRAPVRTYKLKA
jgi:ATP-dependent protease HslVU (ClpYQ) peptidase subunit